MGRASGSAVQRLGTREGVHAHDELVHVLLTMENLSVHACLRPANMCTVVLISFGHLGRCGTLAEPISWISDNVQNLKHRALRETAMATRMEQ